MTARGPRQLPILVVLAVAFAGRVAAQLTQYLADVTFLPAFEDWQSGALPYSALLASQMVILAVMAVVLRRALSGRLRLSDVLRTGLRVFGLCYFLFMAFRLVAGLTFLDGDGWFDARLPSIFHLLLASFVLATTLAPSSDNGTVATETPT